MAGSDGKPDFLSINLASVIAQGSAQHIGKYCRLQTGCIRVNQEKQRFLGQKLCAELYQRIDGILDFPDFSFGASSVRGRVHNNSVIVIAAADFTFCKLHAVVHDPADGRITETGGDGIFFCPGYHTLRSVYMGHACPCRCRSERCAASVGEKIQYFDGAVGMTDFIAKPVPVYRLFREQSGVLEAERLKVEVQASVMDIPL